MAEDDEKNRELEEWLKGRPPIIRELALKYPGDTCYTQEGEGHYTIISYQESGTLKIVHGRDSFRPGFAVFGVPPETLRVCGCGKWEPPTTEQIQAVHAQFRKPSSN